MEFVRENLRRRLAANAFHCALQWNHWSAGMDDLAPGYWHLATGTWHLAHAIDDDAASHAGIHPPTHPRMVPPTILNALRSTGRLKVPYRSPTS